ncbi:hypothetical protein FRC19_002134 [Serendipita sp. 401]|nr:hypothetical protein FRC19_002134 [Serendipita sp. 401]KAG9046770.1 hypothetical protein FS842_000800 [Serendipita sp. 407]
MSNIQRSASNPEVTLKTQSHATLEPFDASSSVDYSLLQICGWMPTSPGFEESGRLHDHKEIREVSLCEREHDTDHPATLVKPEQPAERGPRPIQESKASSETSSWSCNASTVNGKATSPGTPNSSPQISRAALDTVNDAISEFLELTANLRNARYDGPGSVLGKRRGFEDDEENVEIEMTSKRRRTGAQNSSPEYHTTGWSILNGATIVSPNALIPEGTSISRRKPDRHSDTSRSDSVAPTKFSVLPFPWAEDECDPLANAISPSLHLDLYDTAWTALRTYKHLVEWKSRVESVSEARHKMYLAWSTWAEARTVPPTLLWLYHTGYGLDSEGRNAIARAMKFDRADRDLMRSVQKWIEKGSHPLAEIQDLPGPNSPVEAAEGHISQSGKPKLLVPVPEEMVGDGTLPSWARCCLYSNSKDSLEAHLAQKPASLKKKEETKIIKLLFDKDGNERFSVDKRGRKTMISEGTRAYHSLPDDQKMVILEGRDEVMALSANKREKDFVVVCQLGFTIEEGKRFDYKDSRCGCLLASKDDALRHIKEQHFGLSRKQKKTKRQTS